MMKLDKQERIEIFENAITYIVVMGMLAYGVGKIVQFNNVSIFTNKTIAELSGMQLMWAFYGYSKSFVYILGFLEIAGGLLMLFKPMRIFGSLLITVILINIILQDIFYGVHFGALLTAIFYQVIIFTIFFIHRQKLIEGLKLLLLQSAFANARRKFYLKILLSILLFLIIRYAEFLLVSQ